MSTESEVVGSNIIQKEGSTEELHTPLAPVRFRDEFLGFTLDKTIWQTVEVELNTAIALKANSANGAVLLQMDADNIAQDAVLYWGDQRGISAKQGGVFECVLDVAVLPTGSATVVWGMAHDHNLVKDSIAKHAWFRLDGSGVLKLESNDATINTDDQSTGTTLVAGVSHIYRIDFTDTADVKFYLDGVRLLATTTFDISALTDDGGVMQPYFSLDKGAATSVGSLLVDAVNAWSNRS